MAKYEYVREEPAPRENLNDRLLKTEVIRVIDGDTIHIRDSDFFAHGVPRNFDGTIPIRLSGIGAPEGSSDWDMPWDNYDEYELIDFEEDQPKAEEAFRFVYDLSQNKNVKLDIRTDSNGNAKLGFFNRPVAIVYVKNQNGEWININRSLLKNNLVSPYYVNKMNLSDEQKTLWRMEPLKTVYNEMETDAKEFNKDNRDNFLGSFNPEQEVRIGDTILPIPPEQINITTLNNMQPKETLRNGSTVMSSNGHNINRIEMEIYFNGSNEKTFEIDGEYVTGDEINGFPKKADGKYDTIKQNGEEYTPTYYINGLRPLMAQFKLTPFLPIENDYINNKHNINAVTLQNIMVTNVKEYPGLLKAKLVVLEFNHQVYVDTFKPFRTIFDWELFRFYYQRIIEGTGINHDGTKLPEYSLDDDFSFDITSIASLQEFENAKKTLSTLLKEYQIDLTEGKSTYEKTLHDMELMKKGRSQKEKINNEIYGEDNEKQNYDLDDVSELKDLRKWYENYCQNEENNVFERQIFKPHDYKALVDNPNRATVPYDGQTFVEYVNYGKSKGHYVIRLRSSGSIIKLKNILAQANSITNYESYTLEKIQDITGGKEVERKVDDELEPSEFDDTHGMDELKQAYITPSTFNKLYNYVVNLGESVQEQRDEAEESVYGDYEHKRTHYEFDDINIQNVQVSLVNGVNSLSVNMQSKPAHQYLGTKETRISISMATQNAYTIQRLQTIINHVKAMELRYGSIIDEPLVKFNNDIVDMFNLDGVYIKEMTTQTVPQMPGLYQINLTFIGYRESIEDPQNLSRQYKTDVKKDRDIGENHLNDYFNIKEQMNKVCLYPDLELPRYCDLPIDYELYKPNDESFVDPDFYAMNINKLFIEDVIKAVFGDTDYDIMGKDTEGNSAEGTVKEGGKYVPRDEDTEDNTDEDTPYNLYDLAQKEGDIGYEELMELSNKTKGRNNVLKTDLKIPKKEFQNKLNNSEPISVMTGTAEKDGNEPVNNNRNISFLSYAESVKSIANNISKNKIGTDLLLVSSYIRWHNDYIDFDDKKLIKSNNVYFDSNDNTVDKIERADKFSPIRLPNKLVDDISKDSLQRLSHYYKPAVAKYEYEAYKLSNILIDFMPKIKLDDFVNTEKDFDENDEKNAGDSIASSAVNNKRHRRKYYRALYKLIAYLLINGLTLQDIKNNNEAYQGYERAFNKASDLFNTNVISLSISDEMIDIDTMFVDLPEIVSRLMENLESMEGSTQMHKIPDSFLQQRSAEERFKETFYDMLEYDKRGRLVRAFPSFYMMMIDEGREFMWWKLQDLFYEYNGVKNIDLIRSKNNSADTCLIQMTNSDGNLSDAVGAYRSKSYDLDFWETLWSLTPFAEMKWDIKKRNSEFESIRLQTGARIHLRMGYGSNPNGLPTLFNGTITELQLGETVTCVAQNDGIELNKPIPASPNQTTEYEWLGSIQEPKEIITDILGNKGGMWAYLINKVSDDLFYDENEYGVQHFGAIERPDWWDDSTLMNERHPKLEKETKGSETDSYEEDPPRGYEVAQNINQSMYDDNRFAVSLYGKTVWDVMETCAMTSPNYMAAVHPFGFRNTIFYGHPNFDMAYDYTAERVDSDNAETHYKKYARDEDGNIPVENVKEALKPYRQMHFYSSFYDIVANHIQTSERKMYTAVNPIMTSGGGDPKEISTVYLDTDIYPSKQKLINIDTSIATPDIFRTLLQSLELQDEEERRSASRFGKTSLQQFVQNMYGGELITLGDPTVKPHDYSYIADVSNHMSGMFEVEKVVQSFNPQTGFLTSITPDPVSSVNDQHMDGKFPDENIQYWKWSKSKLNQIYTKSVIFRMIGAQTAEIFKNAMISVFKGLDSNIDNVIRNSDMASFFGNLNATTLLQKLGKKMGGKAKTIGSKMDEFMVWLGEFLDNSSYFLEDVEEVAGKAGRNILKGRSKIINLGRYIDDAKDMGRKYPGLLADLKKYHAARKAGYSRFQILDDVDTFKRIFGYGLNYADDAYALLTGPYGLMLEFAIEWVVTRKIGSFLSNMRANREVLTLMLLNKDGREFSAGIEGHAGCVIGDDPSDKDKFWHHPVMDFLIGDSQTQKFKEQAHKSMLADANSITDATQAMTKSGSQQYAMNMLKVNSIEEMKQKYKESFDNYMTKVTVDRTVQSNDSESDSNTKALENTEDDAKTTDTDDKTVNVFDVDASNKSEWIDKVSNKIKNNDNVLKKYKGHKIHPIIIDLLDDLSQRQDIEIEMAPLNDRDYKLFNNGLAVTVKNLTTINIKTLAENFHAKGYKGFRMKDNKDGTYVQIDLCPYSEIDRRDIETNTRGLEESIRGILKLDS